MGKEFLIFIKKYAVVGAAIGIVTGQAVTNYVKILVDNTINPVLIKVLSEPTAQCSLEQFGACVSNLLSGTVNFLVIMFFVFIIIKFLISKLIDEKID